MLDGLSREPRGSRADWWGLASGSLLLFISLFLIFSPNGAGSTTLHAGMAIIGFEVALGTVAEFLPDNARRLVILLRIISIALSIVGAAVIIAALWSMVS